MSDASLVDQDLVDRVEQVVRQVAAEEILPRWRRLAEDDIAHKTGPHDLVTTADRRAEQRLGRELGALLPGAVLVGEEGVHDDPARYAALDGEAPVWVVDPVDGTRQFVEGDPGFCTLVTLARRGKLLASWTHAPALGQLAVARRGGGAWLDGARLVAGSPAAGATLRIAYSHPAHTTDAQKRALTGLWAPGAAPRPCGAAGLEYLAIARGELDGLAFSWQQAWDHAAGLLLLTEAGGVHLTPDGVPFRLAGRNALPFAAARDAATARRILGLLAAGPTADV